MSSPKAVFLLFVVLTSLVTAMLNPFYMAEKSGVCCAKKAETKSCHKPAQDEKKSCSRDYCNPFQSCSTTAALIAQVIQFHGVSLHQTKQFSNFEMIIVSGFRSKHWQPPQV